MKVIKIRLKKIKELDDVKHPNNISEGFIKEIKIPEEHFEIPSLGERFPRNYFWSTSPVQEIIDQHTFKTFNSIYHWEFVKN